MVDKYYSISYDTWAGQMLTINKWSNFNKRQWKYIRKYTGKKFSKTSIESWNFFAKKKSFLFWQRKLVNKGLFYILKIYAYNNTKERYDLYV